MPIVIPGGNLNVGNQYVSQLLAAQQSAQQNQIARAQLSAEMQSRRDTLALEREKMAQARMDRADDLRLAQQRLFDAANEARAGRDFSAQQQERSQQFQQGQSAAQRAFDLQSQKENFAHQDLLEASRARREDSRLDRQEKKDDLNRNVAALTGQITDLDRQMNDMERFAQTNPNSVNPDDYSKLQAAKKSLILRRAALQGGSTSEMENAGAPDFGKVVGEYKKTFDEREQQRRDAIQAKKDVEERRGKEDAFNDEVKKSNLAQTTSARLASRIKNLTIDDAETAVRNEAERLKGTGVTLDESDVQNILANSNSTYRYWKSIQDEVKSMDPSSAVQHLQNQYEQLTSPRALVDRNGAPMLDKDGRQKTGTLADIMRMHEGVNPDELRRTIVDAQGAFAQQITPEMLGQAAPRSNERLLALAIMAKRNPGMFGRGFLQSKTFGEQNINDIYGGGAGVSPGTKFIQSYLGARTANQGQTETGYGN